MKHEYNYVNVQIGKKIKSKKKRVYNWLVNFTYTDDYDNSFHKSTVRKTFVADFTVLEYGELLDYISRTYGCAIDLIVITSITKLF